jgi:hypothetical protein
MALILLESVTLIPTVSCDPTPTGIAAEEIPTVVLELEATPPYWTKGNPI